MNTKMIMHYITYSTYSMWLVKLAMLFFTIAQFAVVPVKYWKRQGSALYVARFSFLFCVFFWYCLVVFILLLRVVDFFQQLLLAQISIYLSLYSLHWNILIIVIIACYRWYIFTQFLNPRQTFSVNVAVDPEICARPRRKVLLHNWLEISWNRSIYTWNRIPLLVTIKTLSFEMIPRLAILFWWFPDTG